MRRSQGRRRVISAGPLQWSGHRAAEQQSLAGRQTEGMAWLTSAISVGTAAGSAAVGQVIDAAGARCGYTFAAACAAGAVLACSAHPARRFRRRPDPDRQRRCLAVTD